MGHIVGAALVSHHPGLMQCEEFRRLMGNGEDSDLIPGYARLRETCAEHNVEVFETFMGLSGLVNVGKGAMVVAFAAEAHKFE